MCGSTDSEQEKRLKLIGDMRTVMKEYHMFCFKRDPPQITIYNGNRWSTYFGSGSASNVQAFSSHGKSFLSLFNKKSGQNEEKDAILEDSNVNRLNDEADLVALCPPIDHDLLIRFVHKCFEIPSVVRSSTLVHM